MGACDVLSWDFFYIGIEIGNSLLFLSWNISVYPVFYMLGDFCVI